MIGLKLAATGMALFAAVGLVAHITGDDAPLSVKVWGCAAAVVGLLMVLGGFLLAVWTA